MDIKQIVFDLCAMNDEQEWFEFKENWFQPEALGGKWILSKHKKRSTWETQGGHIEDGETPLECAKRELFEESGIKDADIYPVCDYWGFNCQSCSNGMVFLAVVHSLGELPESEMKETKIFDTLPTELTYPQTSPKLYAEAEKVLRKL